MDFAAGSGGIWYYIPLMIIFFFLLLEIVTEKELEMRVGMQVMGLYSSAYWLSWSIYAVIMVTSSTLLIQVWRCTTETCVPNAWLKPSTTLHNFLNLRHPPQSYTTLLGPLDSCSCLQGIYKPFGAPLLARDTQNIWISLA